MIGAIQTSESGSPERLTVSLQDLLQDFEKIGERLGSSLPRQPNPKKELPIGNGRIARIDWLTTPIFSRPDHWLPSGGITVEDDSSKNQGIGSNLYYFGREISDRETQPRIIHARFDLDGNEMINRPLSVFDKDVLREVDRVLKEIDRALGS